MEHRKEYLPPTHPDDGSTCGLAQAVNSDLNRVDSRVGTSLSPTQLRLLGEKIVSLHKAPGDCPALQDASGILTDAGLELNDAVQIALYGRTF